MPCLSAETNELSTIRLVLANALVATSLVDSITLVAASNARCVPEVERAPSASRASSVASAWPPSAATARWSASALDATEHWIAAHSMLY